MNKVKKNYLYIEIDTVEDDENKFNSYKNNQGQYVIECSAEIEDFHFHFGPGPEEKEKNQATE